MTEPLLGFTFNHADQPDRLSDTMTPAEVKVAFDSRAEEVRLKLNEIISDSNLDNFNFVNVLNSPYFASGSSEATTGSITSGKQQLTVSSAIDFVVNHGVRIVGAGVAGADLVTTIVSISGTSLELGDAASTTVSGASVYHDDTASISAAISAASLSNKTVVIPMTSGAYSIYKFNGIAGVNVIGVGKPRIDLYYGGSDPVLVGLKSDSIYENIYFNCTESDLEWSRTDITNQNNVTIKNCRFEGFRHDSPTPNAWGIYLDGSTNVRILNSQFENNSLSDIAMVEGTQNIVISNVFGSNLSIDLEPNDASSPVKNIAIVGCEIAKLYALENSLTAYCIQGVHIDSCHIGEYVERGGDVTFTNSTIGTVTPQNGTYTFMGTVNYQGAMELGKNLVKDPNLCSVSTATTSNWTVSYASTSGMYDRVDDAKYGRLLRLNPSNLTQQVVVESKAISCAAGDKYLLAITSKGKYPTGSTFISTTAQVRFYDSGGSIVTSYTCSNAKAALGSESPLSTECGTFTVPNNAVSFRVRLSNCFSATSPASLDVVAVTAHKVTTGFARCTTGDDMKRYHGIVTGQLSFSAAEIPTTGKGYVSYSVGDRCYLDSPAAGGTIGSVATTAGTPGTWKSFGSISA